MKFYLGIRDKDGTLKVTVNGQPLNPRLDLWNHSPTGYECGYGGSGPAQLALAILADCLHDDQIAVQLHQSFKWSVVVCLPRADWALTEAQIRQAVNALK